MELDTPHPRSARHAHSKQRAVNFPLSHRANLQGLCMFMNRSNFLDDFSVCIQQIGLRHNYESRLCYSMYMVKVDML